MITAQDMFMFIQRGGWLLNGIWKMDRQWKAALQEEYDKLLMNLEMKVYYEDQEH